MFLLVCLLLIVCEMYFDCLYLATILLMLVKLKDLFVLCCLHFELDNPGIFINERLITSFEILNFCLGNHRCHVDLRPLNSSKAD